MKNKDLRRGRIKAFHQFQGTFAGCFLDNAGDLGVVVLTNRLGDIVDGKENDRDSPEQVVLFGKSERKRVVIADNHGVVAGKILHFICKIDSERG